MKFQAKDLMINALPKNTSTPGEILACGPCTCTCSSCTACTGCSSCTVRSAGLPEELHCMPSLAEVQKEISLFS
ncbi:MAG: hypothetical protein GFH25_541324n33 [Chloroflexi bacterium AL-N10]|nr:hypothetical protein [Chloroflexi bacterium AL-N10]